MAKLSKAYASLASKLILATSVLLFGGSLVFGLVFFNYSEKVLLRNLKSHARSSAGIVQKSLRYGMLNARYGVMQQTVETLATLEDINEIKVMDRTGRVVFASDSGLTGTAAQKSAAITDALNGVEPEPEITVSENGLKVLRSFQPILNEPACFNAACHVHREDEKVLGVMETSFSTHAIEATRQQMFTGTLLFGAIFVFCTAMLMILVLYKFVSRPVARLEAGMKRLSKGDFDTPIEIKSHDEMGLLAETFNTMALDIKKYRERMENWTMSLQDEVDKKTNEIVNAQEQIINAEKLASLGRMAAGVAHELNSPLTGVLTFAHLLRSRTPPDRKEDIEDLDVIIEQTNRCSKIIKGMLGFARKGVSEASSININSLLEAVVQMVKNTAKFHNVEVVLELGQDLPRITMDPNQMQQVFLNFLTNAADAMDNNGRITITTRTISEDPDKKLIELEFTDNGPGILPDNLGKIFEPFFTTKPVGKGTGLGLPVSYGIIKKHGGEIVVRSKVGTGTTFFVRMPIDPPAAKPGKILSPKDLAKDLEAGG